MKPSAPQLFALQRARATTITARHVNCGGLGVTASTWRSCFKHGLLTWDLIGRVTLTPAGESILVTYRRVPGSRRVVERSPS